MSEKGLITLKANQEALSCNKYGYPLIKGQSGYKLKIEEAKN